MPFSDFATPMHGAGGFAPGERSLPLQRLSSQRGRTRVRKRDFRLGSAGARRGGGPAPQPAPTNRGDFT